MSDQTRSAAPAWVTILLVEDDEPLRSLVRGILRRSGYAVVDAQSGPEAIALCEQISTPIDLLVADLTLAGMSGLQAAEQLARHRSAMKVLIMSGHSRNHPSIRDAMKRGAAFLPKPFEPDDLLQRVRELVGVSPARSC